MGNDYALLLPISSPLICRFRFFHGEFPAAFACAGKISHPLFDVPAIWPARKPRSKAPIARDAEKLSSFTRKRRVILHLQYRRCAWMYPSITDNRRRFVIGCCSPVASSPSLLTSASNWAWKRYFGQKAFYFLYYTEKRRNISNYICKTHPQYSVFNSSKRTFPLNIFTPLSWAWECMISSEEI